MATATQPWRSKAKLRIIHRLHMYANHNLGIIISLGQEGSDLELPTHHIFTTIYL